MEEIKIRGARIHNLKKINLSIPKHQFVVITGISGSGKSSLAFDILFEEGKNQYLRSIGILTGLDKEDRFDTIEGIGPAVAVRQNTVRQSNPRSTVGTKTSILNQLALVFASDGMTEHHSPGDFLYTTAEGMCVHCQGKGFSFEVYPHQLVPNRKTSLQEVYEKLGVTAGFLKLLRKKYGEYFDMPFWELEEELREELIYGTFDKGKQSYCLERILRNAYEKGEDVEAVYRKSSCRACEGNRIGEEARAVYLGGKHIGELGQMTLSGLYDFLNVTESENLSVFGKNVIKNVIRNLRHLIRLRLGHLTLYREMASLSGGEIQRVFLHLHLESGLDSLIYVFDEPMAGLHPSEKESMIQTVRELRDMGNTVIIVEHDREIIRQADHIIEIGPGAGKQGGYVVFQGNYEEYEKADTLLSPYFSGRRRISSGTDYRRDVRRENCITIEHADIHYLKNLTVSFPLHAMVGIAGLSGSGKSSLVEETLLKRLTSKYRPGYNAEMTGAECISGFVKISQEPIGRSTNSTPASYIGIWDKIRQIYAEQPDAKKRELSAGHFSFHSKGACTACSGSGYERVFLTSDFSVNRTCPVCRGKRLQEECLKVCYRGKNIAEVLEMSIAEAGTFFEDVENIRKPLYTLEQMGMGYLTLGQPSSSLSGGEAQRVKLAKELGRPVRGNMLYVLDEPTTGLSPYDTELLLKLLNQLVDSGNSVIIIEHNTDILDNCDYIIELGPEGGDRGGEIIAEGTPEELRNNPNSKTGRYLA